MKRTLEITTVGSCPLRCSFCPQDKLRGSYNGGTVLRPNDFIEVLAKLPPDVEVHFSGFAEPFLHPHISFLLALAKDFGRTLHIYTTLFGFNRGHVNATYFGLLDPDVVRIHVPDKEALLIPDEGWIASHELFRQSGYFRATYMTMGEMTPQVRDYLDGLHITVERPDMLSRGGNLWEPKKIEGPLVCSMDRWHSNVLLPNGDVYLCCMDYSLTTKLGNLFVDSYDLINEKAEMWKIMGEPPAMCRQCEWARPA